MILPRMLVTETSLRRAKASSPRPYWSQGKKKQQQHRRHASTAHEDVVFRSRCYAFLTGNWAPLLKVHRSARRIVHATDDKKLSQDILALIHGGQLDAKNAFNSIHRRTFLKVVAERFPGLWSWVWSNYGEPTELYVRRDNLEPEVIHSRSGTRQGCPLGCPGLVTRPFRRPRHPQPCQP
jgi:hypothetical protein